MQLYEVIARTLRSVMRHYPPPMELSTRHLREIIQHLMSALVPWKASRTPTAGELRSLGYDLVLNPTVTAPDVPDDAELILNIGVSPEGDGVNFTAAFRIPVQKRQESASVILQRQVQKKGLTKQQRRELLDDQ